MTTNEADGGARRPTIYDVAREASVSHQTVSRLLNGQSNIRPDLRHRIEAALAKLDYRPNQAAKSLARRKSGLLGALLYDITEMGPSKSAQGAAEAAREAGYFLDMLTVDPRDVTAIDQALALLRERDLEGLVIQAPTDAIVERLSKVAFDWPVAIEQEADDRVAGHEPGHNRVGMTMLVDHLHSLGHRAFHHIAGPSDWISARNRTQAYYDALDRYGLTSTGTSSGDWSAASGYEAVMGIARLDFTALVVANDQMALGAMLALRQRGVSLPQEMSVVGFDDLPESAYFFPPLTTVAQNFRAQGRQAVDTLLRQIGATPLETVGSLDPILRLRASTVPPAAAPVH